LGAFGVDLAREMPYHETLTVFWMRAVSEFNASKNGASLLDKTNALVAEYDKDHPLKFYTREYLFSDEARARFVEGDLSSLGDPCGLGVKSHAKPQSTQSDAKRDS